MTLEVVPEDGNLKFYGPFNVVSITKITLFNKGNDRLIFKIKTTAPKRYCVKPNTGFLDPNTSTTVQIMLQPARPNNQNNEFANHKFMLQWSVVPRDYDGDENSFWEQYISKSHCIQDIKLRCVFVDGRLENKETQTDAHLETPVLTTKIDFLDSDRVVDGPPEPELLCSICQNVLWKPVACITCENAFCSKCIHMWIERLDVSCRTTCPFKCNFNKKRAPPILNSLLSKLKIYCVYRDNGCQQILNYDVLENHQQTCDYKDIVCPVCQMCITKQDPTNTVHDIRQCFAGIKNIQTVGQIQAQLTMLLDIIDHQKKHIQTLENRLNSSTE